MKSTQVKVLAAPPEARWLEGAGTSPAISVYGDGAPTAAGGVAVASPLAKLGACKYDRDTVTFERKVPAVRVTWGAGL
jgi:hypothetical protein